MATEDKGRHYHQLGHVLMQPYAGVSTNINHVPIQYSCHLWNTTQPKLPNVLCQEYRDLSYSLYINPCTAYIIYSVLVCRCQRNSSQHDRIAIAQTRDILNLLLRKLETKSLIFLDVTWQVGICQNIVLYPRKSNLYVHRREILKCPERQTCHFAFPSSDTGTCR